MPIAQSLAIGRAVQQLRNRRLKTSPPQGSLRILSSSTAMDRLGW
jgi:hypothetical protein